ncbi:hypothetical protein PLICRDRAFT_202489 [Plicaturopsis crispa FD-325 SS-3]|nr:hypothetical protein PLICRDRAFT_202489 [Plicaturopsis crispa FD-325 SS-3]
MQPPEQCTQRLVRDAKDGSPDSLVKLATCIKPATPEELIYILSALDVHLEPSGIPALQHTDTEIRHTLALFTLSIIRSVKPHLTKGYGPRIVSKVTAMWPRAWAWLQFFFATSLKADDDKLIGLIRPSVFKTEVCALDFFLNTPELSSIVRTTPGAMDFLLDLWVMEANDPRLDHRALSLSSAEVPYLGSVVNGFMFLYTNHDDVSRADTDRLVHAIESTSGRTVADIASAALNNIRQERLHWLPNFQWIGTDLLLLDNLCGNSYLLINETLAQNSIPLVIEVLEFTAKRHNTSDLNARFLIYECMSYLGRMVQETQSDGHPYVVHAVEAGLFPALVLCDQWLSHLSEKERKPYLTLLREILPRYTVSLPAIEAFKKSLDSISDHVETRTAEALPVWSAWTAFKALVADRWSLKDDPNTALRTYKCGNDLCGNVDETRTTFKRCSRCRSVVYCSTACQNADWKISHKLECSKRASDDAVESDSAKFVTAIATRDFKDRVESIFKEAAAQEIQLPFVTFDYTVFPVKVVTQSPTKRPAICSMSAEARKFWDSFVRQAEEVNKARGLIGPLAIVRAVTVERGEDSLGHLTLLRSEFHTPRPQS